MKDFKASQSDKRDNPSPYKEPDLILVGETDDEGEEESYDSSKIRWLKESWINRQNPLLVRFVFFFGTLIFLIVSIAMLLWTAFNFCLAALLLFQNESLNQSLKSCLGIFLNCLVIVLGLAIAIFSPLVGVGLIVVYFSLK